MLSAQFVEDCIKFTRNYEQTSQSQISPSSAVSSNTTAASTFSSLSFGTSSSVSSYMTNVLTISEAEASSYYAGLPSEPRLLYRTGKKWSPPSGPEAQRRCKELCEVFMHRIREVWNHDLCWKVVKILDAHMVHFTTIDVVRFKTVKVDEEPDEPPVISPITIWIGVFYDSTSATTAHDAAQDVLMLLKDYNITDIDVDFRESLYMHESGPPLLRPVDDLDPLVDIISPLTPVLGLRISTKARPDAQGTMALYLASEGGKNNKLLGLSCRHVLIGSKEANDNYTYHRSGPSKDVLLLGNRAFTDVVDSIKLRVGFHGIEIKRWKKQIEGFKEREKGTDVGDVEKAKFARTRTEGLLDDAGKAMEALAALLNQVEKCWKKLDDRVLGHILHSPAIKLGVGEEKFTEDWGIFQVNQAKLGDGFKGNMIDLGTKIKPGEFTHKCFPRGDANWEFEYPEDRLLPLKGIVTDELMHTPDMWDSNGEPCLLVVKNGNATGTTIGRANGIFSITREYFRDMSIHQTSMEWGIINYDSKSGAFSKPGDSGSIIADIRGRIGGMLTGGAGNTQSSDITYATPFWWLLERIKANAFPNAYVI